MQIQKRKIQHQRFQNWSSTVALQSLKKEDNGEFYFRPSSRGVDNLTLTWKFFENNIVHIDIKETEKAIGANIGSKLLINEDSFDNLQEIVERYITQCNRLVREVTQHQKFQKCNDMDELNQILLKEKQENESSIPYKFTILDEYPQFIILAYVPKKDVVREFLKVKPKGYFFHHQYQYPFQNLINWFKKQFKSREYQVYLRKAQSPQRIIQFANQQQIKANQPLKNCINEGDGMQIDSGNVDKWGQNNDVNPVKKENGISNFKNQKDNDGWGEQSIKQSPQKNDFNSKQKNGWGDDVSSNVKDEKERGGWDDQKISFQSPQRSENNFRGGAGRGRGGGQGGGRNCFKCGEEGHMSRECPNQDSKQKGMGRGGRQNKCFNCDQEGHMSKDCTEQKKERGGGSKCYNCQKDGHMSRECPEPKAQRSVNKCFNCQQEGHMSRECPEPRKERPARNGGEDFPYKRQRNEDGGSFRRPNNQEGWKNEGGDAWGKSSQIDNNQNNSQENGWGNAAGGWGDNNQESNIQMNDNNQSADAWGNNDVSKNESAGWN